MKTLLLIGAMALFFVESVAQTTSIPDSNFEQALIDLGYDSGPIDGSVTTANINSITFLGIDFYSISDLTGIEDFTSLDYLVVQSNSFSNLNIENASVTTIDINNNNLMDSLDVSLCSNLENLIAVNCNLVYLNPPTNIQLLDIQYNSFVSLDFSSLPNLYTLDCNNNLLNSLTINSNCRVINCHNNQLTELDLSLLVGLEQLRCENNQLECLNVKNGNNSNITYFSSANNPSLTCIEVDNVSFSATNWSNIDIGVTFSLNCGNSCSSVTTGIQNVLNSNLILFPNPTDNLLNLSGDNIETVKVFDLNGKLVLSEIYNSPSIILDVDVLSPGLYAILVNDSQHLRFAKQR